MTYYDLTSNQFTGLNGIAVPGTLRDSLVLLAVVLEQQTELQPTQIMTDTGAYSDVIFGLSRLLGYRFSPRLADIGGTRFWRIDPKADYGQLNWIARQRVDLVPELLFGLRPHMELARIDVGNRPAETVIGFAAVEGFLHALPQRFIVNEVEDVECAANVIQFPQCLLGLVLAAIRSELADDGRLRHIFLRKRRHDALNVGPFLADQRVEYLARGLDKEILIVIRMHEPDQRIHSVVQVAVAWREAITEYMKNPEVNLIGAMRIGRMAFWFDVSRVVVQ